MVEPHLKKAPGLLYRPDQVTAFGQAPPGWLFAQDVFAMFQRGNRDRHQVLIRGCNDDSVHILAGDNLLPVGCCQATQCSGRGPGPAFVHIGHNHQVVSRRLVYNLRPPPADQTTANNADPHRSDQVLDQRFDGKGVQAANGVKRRRVEFNRLSSPFTPGIVGSSDQLAREFS